MNRIHGRRGGELVMTMNKNIKSELPEQVKKKLNCLQELSNEQCVYSAGKLIEQIEEVDVDMAFKTVEQRIEPQQKLRRLYQQFSKIAAVLIIPLFIISLRSAFVYFSSECNLQTQNEITCPTGIRSKVVLPDGTVVWLNSESKIKYSIPFVNSTRNVELIGEAFLDVAKNEKSPFVIESRDAKIRVLGTQFNFKAYPDEDKTYVSLIEGSIQLNLRIDGENVSETKLHPGEYLIFDRMERKAHISTEKIENHIGWVNNRLILDDTPMLEMEKILERWYGVDVEVLSQDVYAYKFTTTFDNLPLNQVIDLLRLSSKIDIKYIPGEYDKQTKQISKSKILISKHN